MNCICCGSQTDYDNAYCAFCDALHDLIEDADNEANSSEDMSEELELKMAYALKAYDQLDARRNTCRDVSLGEGCNWIAKKAAA